MPKKVKPLKITKEQLRKNDRKISREIEIERNGKWIQTHKVHPSDKTYNRKKSRDPLDSDE